MYIFIFTYIHTYTHTHLYTTVYVQCIYKEFAKLVNGFEN